MSHRVAIIGNHGFIGSVVSSYLSTAGHVVHGFNSDVPALNNSGELSADLVNADVVIWAASRVNPAIAKTSPSLILQELKVWESFLNAMVDQSANSIARIIFLSSGGCVYDKGESPFSESRSSRGINEYGQLKVQMEEMLRNSGLSHTILRASNIYGPNQPAGRGQGVIAEWISALRTGQKPKVYGNLESERDYLFVSDLCRAIEKAFDCEISQTFNIGSGVGTSLQTLMNSFSMQLGKSLEFEISSARTFDRDSYWLDIGKAKTILNWKPIVGMSNGIRACLTTGGGK